MEVGCGYYWFSFAYFVGFSPFLDKGEITEFGGLLDKVRREEAGRSQRR